MPERELFDPTKIWLRPNGLFPVWRDEPGGDGGFPCALCDGDGEVCNPKNADPEVAVVDWHPPVICPRCGGTGRDPNLGTDEGE